MHTKVFLKFDPDRSVFYLDKRGYILDPTIETDSVVSMTSAQDLRFIQALGQRSNLVSSEAEIIFQGSVSRLQYLLAPNVYNKQMVYSDMDIQVEDRLRTCASTRGQPLILALSELPDRSFLFVESVVITMG